jgi:hypothetical protein
MKRVLAVALALAPVVAHADQVVIRGGGTIDGVVVERTDTTITLDVGPGRITLPLNRVERVVESTSALEDYRHRTRQLAAADAKGWLALGLWAQDHDLSTQAAEAFEHVLLIDPQNATAHRALNHVQVGGAWMTPEDGYRARGLVPFEGNWVSPQERDAIVQARADEIALERARVEATTASREADARVREAEARARTAEAEAKAAANAGAPTADPYYPPYAYAGPMIVGPGVVGGGGHHSGGHHHQGTPPPTTQPPPYRPPSSGYGRTTTGSGGLMSIGAFGLWNPTAPPGFGGIAPRSTSSNGNIYGIYGNP